MPSSTSSSEPAPAPGDGLVHADALAEAHREVPAHAWGRIALMALAVCVVLTAGWEVLWRSKGFEAGDVKPTYANWAEARRHATGNATVLIGTSRNLFDVDLDVWEKTTGIRPVQLSLEGTSPLMTLSDLATDPKFKGVVIADVVTGMFFSGDPGGVNEKALPYYHDQTPSQRVGRWLAIPPEYVLAYIDDQTRPKELWRRQELPLREGQRPRFVDPYKLAVATPDRNSEMWGRVLTDTAYRERAARIWGPLFTPPPGFKPPPPPKVIAGVAADIAKIRARGGDVVFVMHPQAGFLAEWEKQLPRPVFWDALLAGTGSGGVNYLDHRELQGFRLPELSHMHPRDAEVYTARLAPLVEAARQDGQRRRAR
jgi:hypothetical protein